jgi:hypothetical protein
MLHPLALKLIGGLLREEILDRTDLSIQLIDLAHEIIAFGTLPGLRRLQIGGVENVFFFRGSRATPTVFRLPGKEAHDAGENRFYKVKDPARRARLH